MGSPALALDQGLYANVVGAYALAAATLPHAGKAWLYRISVFHRPVEFFLPNCAAGVVARAGLGRARAMA